MNRVLGIVLVLCLSVSIVPGSLTAGTLGELEDYVNQEKDWQGRSAGEERNAAVKEAGDKFRKKIETIVKAKDNGVRATLSASVAKEIVAASPFDYNVALDVIVQTMGQSDEAKERLATLADAVVARWRDGALWRGTKKVLVIGGIYLSCSVVGGAVAAKIANRVLHGQGTGGIGSAILMMLGGVVVADVAIGIPLTIYYFYRAFRRNPELVLNPEKTKRLIEAAEASGETIEIADVLPPADEAGIDGPITDEDLRLKTKN